MVNKMNLWELSKYNFRHCYNSYSQSKAKGDHKPKRKESPYLESKVDKRQNNRETSRSVKEDINLTSSFHTESTVVSKESRKMKLLQRMILMRQMKNIPKRLENKTNYT